MRLRQLLLLTDGYHVASKCLKGTQYLRGREVPDYPSVVVIVFGIRLQQLLLAEVFL